MNRVVNQGKNPLQGQVERIDRAFHPLHQIDGGQAADALFTVGLCKADIDFIVLIKFRVLFYFAALNKVRWSIDGQFQLHQLLKNLIVVDGFFQIR